jgi:exosome complex component RRP4
VLLKVAGTDEANHVKVTMKDQGLRKLTGGGIMEISAYKVPRVIGKGGSMINLLKEHTQCRIFVGQNGRIWIDGDVDGISLAMRAINMIDENAHTVGLTENIREFLEKESKEMN